MELLWVEYAITQMKNWSININKVHIPKMPSDRRSTSLICDGCLRWQPFFQKLNNIKCILEPPLWIMELLCSQGHLHNSTCTIPLPHPMSYPKIMPTHFATWSPTWVASHKIHCPWVLELTCTSITPNYMMLWSYTLICKFNLVQKYTMSNK
jgi:hypothetical protein